MTEVLVDRQGVDAEQQFKPPCSMVDSHPAKENRFWSRPMLESGPSPNGRSDSLDNVYRWAPRRPWRWALLLRTAAVQHIDQTHTNFCKSHDIRIWHEVSPLSVMQQSNGCYSGFTNIDRLSCRGRHSTRVAHYHLCGVYFSGMLNRYRILLIRKAISGWRHDRVSTHIRYLPFVLVENRFRQDWTTWMLFFFYKVTA